MFCRLMELRVSVWGRIWCGVWHDEHDAATVNPFLSRPTPWMLSV